MPQSVIVFFPFVKTLSAVCKLKTMDFCQPRSLRIDIGAFKFVRKRDTRSAKKDFGPTRVFFCASCPE